MAEERVVNKGYGLLRFVLGISFIAITIMLLLLLVAVWPVNINNTGMNLPGSIVEGRVNELIPQSGDAGVMFDKYYFMEDGVYYRRYIEKISNDEVEYLSLFLNPVIPENKTFINKILPLSDLEKVYIIITVICGMLGSLVFCLKSFGQHIGLGTFNNNWLWWYFLKPIVGASVALFFYFILRGGLFVGSTPADINIYGVSGMSFMIGMFTEQAVNKLKQLFDTLFLKTGVNDNGDKADDEGEK